MSRSSASESQRSTSHRRQPGNNSGLISCSPEMPGARESGSGSPGLNPFQAPLPQPPPPSRPLLQAAATVPGSRDRNSRRGLLAGGKDSGPRTAAAAGAGPQGQSPSPPAASGHHFCSRNPLQPGCGLERRATRKLTAGHTGRAGTGCDAHARRAKKGRGHGGSTQVPGWQGGAHLHRPPPAIWPGKKEGPGNESGPKALADPLRRASSSWSIAHPRFPAHPAGEAGLKPDAGGGGRPRHAASRAGRLWNGPMPMPPPPSTKIGAGSPPGTAHTKRGPPPGQPSSWRNEEGRRRRTGSSVQVQGPRRGNAEGRGRACRLRSACGVRPLTSAPCGKPRNGPRRRSSPAHSRGPPPPSRRRALQATLGRPPPGEDARPLPRAPRSPERVDAFRPRRKAHPTGGGTLLARKRAKDRAVGLGSPAEVRPGPPPPGNPAARPQAASDAPSGSGGGEGARGPASAHHAAPVEGLLLPWPAIPEGARRPLPGPGARSAPKPATSSSASWGAGGAPAGPPLGGPCRRLLACAARPRGAPCPRGWAGGGAGGTPSPACPGRAPSRFPARGLRKGAPGSVLRSHAERSLRGMFLQRPGGGAIGVSGCSRAAWLLTGNVIWRDGRPKAKGRQRVRWPGGVTEATSMELGGLRKLVEGRAANEPRR